MRDAGSFCVGGRVSPALLVVFTPGLLSDNPGGSVAGASVHRTAWGCGCAAPGRAFETMASTPFQRALCRLIAAQRAQSGESDVAGGVALNTVTRAARISRDIDLFHDRDEAVIRSWESDSNLLRANGYEARLLREQIRFVEALVEHDGNSVLLQRTADRAFRFVSLVEDADFGLVLHPFDLATNKVLAVVGRLEVRDWVDVITCHERIQPLGYLMWATCGKDPGFTPQAIWEPAARSARYSAVEVSPLVFDGPPPDAAQLSKRWRIILVQARRLMERLPVEHVGQCVLRPDGELFRGDETEWKNATLAFPPGSQRGAFPKVKQA